MNKPLKKLILKGKCAVYVDWANVYGWENSLGREIDPQKIFEYLKTYKEIAELRFYFGTDTNDKSRDFLSEVRGAGFRVITKPVKYIPVAVVEGQKIYRRKCDFDMEACIDVHRMLNEGFEGFVFFTGDGDYEPLYKMLIDLGRQVIVVYTQGHLGREIWDMKRGIFKVELKNLIEL